MWALLSFALLATAAASPTSQTLSYNNQMLSSRNDMMSHQLTSEMGDQFKKSCQRYADNEAFDNFISVRTNVIHDIQAAAMEEAAKAVEEGERPNFLDIFCQLSPTIKSSVNKLTNAMKPCLKPGLREEFSHVTNVTDSFLNYVCHNDGERVTSFIRNGGIECITERQNGLSECVKSAVSEEEKENEIDSNIFESNESMNKEDKEKKTAEECREFSEVETCIKRELNQCSNQSASNFVVGLLDSLVKPVCEKYTRN